MSLPTVPWVPMTAASWSAIAQVLPRPWPAEAVRFDLRWHVDQIGRIPGRSALAERWGWTPGEVRTELRHPERWWDPKKGPTPTSRDDLSGGGLTRVDPATTRVDPETTQREWPNANDSGGLTRVDPATTRVDPETPQRVDPPSPSPSHPAAWTVHNAATRQEPDPVEIATLLALEREDGSEVLTHRAADREALITALRSTHTADQLHELIAAAQQRGIRRCRWGLLLGPKLHDLRAELEADRLARERRRQQYRTAPVPLDTPIPPAPPPRTRLR